MKEERLRWSTCLNKLAHITHWRKAQRTCHDDSFRYDATSTDISRAVRQNHGPDDDNMAGSYFLHAWYSQPRQDAGMPSLRAFQSFPLRSRAEGAEGASGVTTFWHSPHIIWEKTGRDVYKGLAARS